jgi:hypothetical protein
VKTRRRQGAILTKKVTGFDEKWDFQLMAGALQCPIARYPLAAVNTLNRAQALKNAFGW